MRLFRTHAVGLRPAIGRAIAVGVTASVLIGPTPVQAQQGETPAQQWAQLRPQRGAKMKRLVPEKVLRPRPGRIVRNHTPDSKIERVASILDGSQGSLFCQ